MKRPSFHVLLYEDGQNEGGWLTSLIISAAFCVLFFCLVVWSFCLLCFCHASRGHVFIFMPLALLSNDDGRGWGKNIDGERKG